MYLNRPFRDSLKIWNGIGLCRPTHSEVSKCNAGTIDSVLIVESIPQIDRIHIGLLLSKVGVAKCGDPRNLRRNLAKLLNAASTLNRTCLYFECRLLKLSLN